MGHAVIEVRSVHSNLVLQCHLKGTISHLWPSGAYMQGHPEWHHGQPQAIHGTHQLAVCQGPLLGCLASAPGAESSGPNCTLSCVPCVFSGALAAVVGSALCLDLEKPDGEMETDHSVPCIGGSHNLPTHQHLLGDTLRLGWMISWVMSCSAWAA